MYFLLHLTSCEEKKLCITKGASTSSLQCTNTIEGITSGSDLTLDISSYLKDSDTDITVYLIGGNIDFNFALNIFNNKNLGIRFDSDSNGTFDVSGINNINIRIFYSGGTHIYPTVKLQGSPLNNDQTSITVEKIKLESDFSDIQLKSFSTKDSIFSFNKLTTNIFNITANSNTELTLKDNSAVFNDQTVTFAGSNPQLFITLTSNRQLVIDNQATSSSFPSLSINTVQSASFKGKDFTESNSISFINCPVIITDIGYLPISSFSFSTGSSTDIKINISKKLTIKGSLALQSSRDLIIGINGNSPSSKVSINIDSVSLERGEIEFLSSWIDLTINEFKFQSTTPPLIPCVGYGGSSTLIANHVTLDDQTSLSFNSISIKLEFNTELTDADLPNLVNSQFNLITFKSFTNAAAVSNFETISFTPEKVYGFGNTESTSIVRIKSTASTDYVVTLTTSSLSSLPYLVCFAQKRGSCTKGGTPIVSLSELETVVPADKKAVTLIINKAYAEIDLSNLKTTGAIFTIMYDLNTYSITSVKTGETYPDPKVDHLILSGISLGNGRGGDSSFNISTREVTIENCALSSPTSLNFNEQTIVNIDNFSFNELISNVLNTLPQTNIITPVESISLFEITNDNYVFSNEVSSVSYSRAKLPKVSFSIQLSSNNDYSLTYKTSTETIDSVDIKFVSDPSQVYNPKITVTFKDLDKIKNANKAGLDFGSFDSGNTVDFSIYTQASYFKITGKNVQIIPDSTKPSGKICTCKATPCSGCESDYTQVSYSQLQQNVQGYTGNAFRIVVIGDKDGTSPSLSIGSLNNKDATIVGAGTNPKIQIDCSSEFTDESKTIEFSNIAVVHSAGDNLHVSNLKLSEGTIIDSSFNTVSLTVGNLNCDTSNLAFNSISVQKSFVLTGDATNSNSNTKVAFQQSSTFTYTLPNLVTISGSKLVFNNLEFDLSNVAPSFSLPQESESFTIVGNNANIDSVASDIILAQTDQLDSVYFNGTWGNQNPSKFIVFKDFSSDLFLNSENIPVNIEYSSFKNIEIEKETVSIAGKLVLSSDSFGDYKFVTPITESTATLSVKEVHVTYNKSGTVNFDFASSNININIETLELLSKFKIICFKFLLDLDNHNQVNIVNPFDESRNQAIRYSIDCTITESLNNPKMRDFITNNHTLMTFNKENSIKLTSAITFADDAPPGFDNNNFKLSNDDNKLTFYTVNSPIEGEIDLYYGKCPATCEGTQITNENLASIDKLVPKDSSLVIVTFYEALPDNSILNFDNSNLLIEYLTLRSTSEVKSVPVRFGKSVTNLEVESISMKNQADDLFSIKKATLSKGASFDANAKLNGLELLTVDRESVFVSGLTEFKNKLDILLELTKSTDVSLSYTKTGMKITDSQSKEFNIDVSKLPNVSITIKSTESPKINLDEGVTELKQVLSLEFDSSIIHIGSNWNSLKAETPIVRYTIAQQETAVSVVTDSFPFEAWDLMYNYAIQFSDLLAPFSFEDDYALNGKKLTFSTYSPSKSAYYDVKFKELELSGESTVKTISEQADKMMIIEEIQVNENSVSKIINAKINDEISLKPGSSLNDNFILADSFSELDLEWDLNKAPLLNPSTLQTLVPPKITIEYKGRSIEGREQLFEDFLSKGVVIMKNVPCDKYIPNIHFKSDSVDEFKDGRTISIKCQCVNTNEVQLVSNDKLLPTEEVIPSSEATPTLHPTPIVPTQGPTVDSTSFSLTSEAVEFTKDGYVDGGKTYSASQNKNDIVLVNSPSTSISASTTSDHPTKELFISPKSKNTVITVESPKGGATDYGSGEIGIHANSNNPTISIPQSKVPLKLFNNEDSEITFNLKGNSDTSISLNNMVMNNGAVKINLPNGVNRINFEKVDAYQSSTINSNNAETRVNHLNMKTGSTVTLTNANFGENIKADPRSKLVINQKSVFNDITAIQLTETSFIEFGDSVVEGVCKEIKLVEVLTSAKSKVLNSNEAEIQLVCGSKFNCSSWAPKFSGDRVFSSAKCIRFKSNNEMCLVASNKYEQGNNGDNKKKGLSTGAIAGIVIACVVVVAIIIGVTVYCVKRARGHKIMEYTGMGEQEKFIDDATSL